MTSTDDQALLIAATLGGSPIDDEVVLGSGFDDYLRRLEATQRTDEYVSLRAKLAADEIDIQEYHRAVGALLEQVGSATA